MFHINVTDTGTTVREQYTTHDLHSLLWEVYMVGMCQVGTVVFLLLSMLELLLFWLRSRAHRCLTYIKCSNLSPKGHEKM